uniref:Ig-like domain-containing protein n=1 Tax=Cebus imitator TaxID=2715852 RepID=A0A2K5PDI0_CEBIM
GQQIMQIPHFQHVQEGEDFTIYCNSSTTLNNIQWYKQRPGGHPVFLIRLVKSREVMKQKRLTFQFGEARMNSSLHITAAQTTDVGTYFCAGHSASHPPAACL